MLQIRDQLIDYSEKILKKHVNPQSTMYEITLSTTSDFSTEMDVIAVTFMEPGSSEVKKFNLSLPGNQEPRDNSIVE